MVDNKDDKGVDMLCFKDIRDNKECLGDNKGLFNHRRYNKEMWDDMKDYKTSSFLLGCLIGVVWSLANYGGVVW